jgi:AraC-like DNA-binding protein
MHKNNNNEVHDAIPSSLGSWAVMLAQTLACYGVDSDTVFSNSGVNLHELRKNQARIVNSKANGLWEQAETLSGDPYFSIKFSNNMTHGALNALGMAMSVSQHAFDAIQRCVRFSDYLNDGRCIALEGNETELALIERPKNNEELHGNSLNVQALFCSIINILRSLSSENLVIKSVCFTSGFQGDIGPFEKHFNCSVSFSSNENKIIFDKKSIYNECVFANSTLAGSLDEWIKGYLPLYNDNLISNKVKDFLFENFIHNKIKQTDVAKHLNFGNRNLQKKLQEEGVSYTELLDACRRKQAFELIFDEKLPLIELSLLLGYSEQSNFTRAFKRWSGSTPYRYRNNK